MNSSIPETEILLKIHRIAIEGTGFLADELAYLKRKASDQEIDLKKIPHLEEGKATNFVLKNLHFFEIFEVSGTPENFVVLIQKLMGKIN